MSNAFNDRKEADLLIDSSLPSRIVSAIAATIGREPVGLHEPTLQGNEWNYVRKCIDSTYVSYVGDYVNQFETIIADYTGAKFSIALVNGTAALHISFLLAGINPNDEVLLPALSFIATANAVTYCGGIPHFVDIESRTLGVDSDRLRDYLKYISTQRDGNCINTQTGRRIKALVPVHTFGHPSDLEPLMGIASDYNLALVEDAAESIGSMYQGQHTGTFGLVGALSFNGNKTVTTGGGGALLTNDLEISERARHLSTTAKLPHAWRFVHNEIGYNYRMPSLNAALGCAQFEKLPSMLEAKRRLFGRYKEQFKNIEGVRLAEEPPSCWSNYWLQILLISQQFIDQQEEILMRTNEAGFQTRPAWTPINELEPYKNNPKMNLDITNKLYKQIICLPSSAFL